MVRCIYVLIENISSLRLELRNVIVKMLYAMNFEVNLKIDDYQSHCKYVHINVHINYLC